MSQPAFIKIKLTFLDEFNFGQKSTAKTKSYIQLPFEFLDSNAVKMLPSGLFHGLIMLLKRSLIVSSDTLYCSRSDLLLSRKCSLSDALTSLSKLELIEIIDNAPLVYKRKEKKIREENIIKETVSDGESVSARGFNFESIFENYPKRAGDHKKKTGLECLVKKVQSQELFDKALQASQNYFKHCEAEGITGTKFVKQFSTFFGKDDTWLEYAEYTPSLVARSPQAKPAFNRAEQRSQANKETLKNYLASLEGEQNEI